jgi:hypothetical protein
MSENKVIYDVKENGVYKSFDAIIDSTLRSKIKSLLQKPKSEDLDISNRMDIMEAKLTGLVKSVEQIHQLLRK